MLRQVHLYLGLGLSLVLLVLAVTGSALVYKDAYWRAVYPELRGPAPDLGPRDHAGAARAAADHFGPALRSVKLPEPGVSAYHLYLDGGEAFLAADDHRIIDVWGPTDRPMAFLFELHAHLMAGHAGERVGGVVGLLGALLVLTGVVVWWPARRRFALASLFPRGLTRRALILSHRDLGALASPILMVLLLTGSGMVFYESARTLLNGIFGDAVPTEPAPAAAEGTATPVPDREVFARAAALFPGARIVFYYPPAGRSGVHGFRIKQPCEVHPNGRSYAYLDRAGRLLRSVDACAATPGDRATHAIYPLHAGKLSSSVYRALVFLGGLALALVSATGALAYLRKLAPAPRVPGSHRPRSSTWRRTRGRSRDRIRPVGDGRGTPGRPAAGAGDRLGDRSIRPRDWTTDPLP